MNIDPDLLNDVKGFLDDEEGRCLYDIALEASRSGPCLEIGSYCGKSTLYLAAGCRRNGGILFSIDHHRGSEEQQPGEAYFDPELLDQRVGKIDTLPLFRETIERGGIEDTVVPIVSRSHTAARLWATPLGLVFIDGGHSLEAAFTDYSAWSRFIIPGGFLLIHDIFPDPAEGGQVPYQVYNLALSSGLFKAYRRVKTLGVLQRIKGDEVPADLAK